MLVVVNQQNDADEESAQYLSDPDVPVVVIDSEPCRITAFRFCSPVAQSRLLFEPEVQSQKTIISA